MPIATHQDSLRQHLAASSESPGIPALTGIRFLAAAAVVVFHYRAEIVAVFPVLTAVQPLMNTGYLGVDLFFTLSGFVLAYNYLTTFQALDLAKYGRFLWLRIARIYPVHFAVLGLLAVSVAVAAHHGHVPHSSGYSFESLVRNLLLIQAWFWSENSWYGPAWSISAEWFAYLGFPLAALWISGFRSARSVLIGGGFALLGMAGTFTAMTLLGHPTFGPQALVRITGEFLAGCFLGRLFQIDRSQRVPWAVLAVVGAIAFPLAASWLGGHGLPGLDAAPLLALVVYATARSDGSLAAWLGGRTMVFLGEASYALYMTHELIHLVVGKRFPVEALARLGLIQKVAVSVGGVTVFLLVASMTHLLIERPARRWLRRMALSPSTNPQRASNAEPSATM
jgi:peptidoglycan/LPS O-acetylase OafA/YrhL